MLSEQLLKKRFGDHYANRLIQAYKGEESICTLAKEFGVRRATISANIIRYLGYKKRYRKPKKSLFEYYFDNKLRRFSNSVLKNKILLLRSVLSKLQQQNIGELKLENRKTIFILDSKIVFYFKYFSSIRTKKVIPVSLRQEDPEGHYIVVSQKGISVVYLKKGYNSVREFINNHSKLYIKFHEFINTSKLNNMFFN